MENHWVHTAHHIENIVKVGDTFSQGEVFARVGDSGAPGASHLHAEIWKEDPTSKWNDYTKGMDSIAVLQRYEDPAALELKPEDFVERGHLRSGYGFLEKTSYGLLHPGWDINVGGGYDDYGLEVKAPFDMEVIWAGYQADPVTGQGWGFHQFSKQLTNKPMTPEERKQLQELVDFKAGMERAASRFRMIEGSGAIVYDAALDEDNTAKELEGRIWSDSSALAAVMSAAGVPMISQEESKKKKYVHVGSARDLTNK